MNDDSFLGDDLVDTAISADPSEDLADEETSAREETDDDVPEGLAHSDPGIESDNWEERETRRGVGDGGDEKEDVEQLGFSIGDGSGPEQTIDPLDEEDK